MKRAASVIAGLGGLLFSGILAAPAAGAPTPTPRLNISPAIDPEAGKGRIPKNRDQLNAAEHALTPRLPTPTEAPGSSTGRLPGDAMLTPGAPHVPLP